MATPARGMRGEAILPGHSIYVEKEIGTNTLGDRLQLGDRVFRYAKAGEAHVPGLLLQSPVPATDHTGLAVTTLTAGSREIVITNGASTALVKNDHQDGFLWADTGTNAGSCYRIRSHPAASINATCKFTLYDPTVEDFTNADETFSLVTNQYRDLIIHPSVPTALVVGVPLIDVQDNYYFWLQTWGPCSVVTEGSVVIGNNVAVGDGTDGGVQAVDTYVEQLVGSVMRVEGGGEYSLIYLRLAY